MSLRDEIRQLCAAHDKLMAGQASKSIRRPPESEFDTVGLVYKDLNNNALADAPAGDVEGLLTEGEVNAAGLALHLARKEMRERDVKIAELRNELAELRGYVRRAFEERGVVDLPLEWRTRHVA